MKWRRPFEIWLIGLLIFISLLTACDSSSPAAEAPTPITFTAQEYFDRGSANRKAGELEQAIADFTKALELDPDLALAYLNRGVAYYNSSEFEQAIRDLERYIELAPNTPNQEEVAKFLEKVKSQLTE